MLTRSSTDANLTEHERDGSGSLGSDGMVLLCRALARSTISP